MSFHTIRKKTKWLLIIKPGIPEDVSLFGVGVALDDFGGHVLARPQIRSHHRSLDPRQTKVLIKQQKLISSERILLLLLIITSTSEFLNLKEQ